MATLAQVRRAAAKVGATVEGGLVGRWRSYQVEAPPGKVWAATGDTHALVLEWRDGEAAYREAAVADCLERMAHGLADCGNPACDYCDPAAVAERGE